MTNKHENITDNGVWYAVVAYILWGGLPLYWKLLHDVPAFQLMCHRLLWSFILLTAVIVWKGRTKEIKEIAKTFRGFLTYFGSAVLIACNWFLYVWAVNSGFVVETSLGYYINPLLRVLIGVFFLRERLRPLQFISIIIAALGVAYLTFSHGSPPWIALVLAFSFAIYGLLKKIAPLQSLTGLALETGMLLVPVVIYLGYCEMTGKGAFLHNSFQHQALLCLSGIVTTVPLALFAAALKRIPLSIAGILQYIAPTIQLLLGIYVFNEPFGFSKFVAYAVIWLALVIFGAEQFCSRVFSGYNGSSKDYIS